MTIEFSIETEAYLETEAMVLDWLKRDCGAIGAAVARAFSESDYGATEIVDALVTNIVGHMPGGITVTQPNERVRTCAVPTVRTSSAVSTPTARRAARAPGG